MTEWTPERDRLALVLHRRDPHHPARLAKRLGVEVDEGQGDLLETACAVAPTVARIVRAAEAIADEPPRRIEFLHSVLCQVGLPRRRVDGLSFERTSGNVSLLLEAGKLWNGAEWQQQPLP
jgi:hypothetical protein